MPRSCSASTHQLTSEGAKVGHPDRILSRHREPEMMPVLLASLDESLRIDIVGSSVEHPGVRAAAGDALASEVGDVLGQGRRAKAAATVAHDSGHDDDATAWRARGEGQRRSPSAANGRAAYSTAASPEGLASVARLRSPHHLADEGLRWPGAPVAVTDPARARAEVVVPCRHARKRLRRSPGWRLGH